MEAMMEVRAAGHRGTHGCTSYVVLENVCIRPLAGKDEYADWSITGTVVEVQVCFTCDVYAEIKVGETHSFKGWIQNDHYNALIFQQ